MGGRAPRPRGRQRRARSQPAKVDAGWLSQNHTKATAISAAVGIGGQVVGRWRLYAPGGQRPGISRFDLNRALQQETVRLARDRGEENRRQLRSRLRQAAAAQPPRHQLLATAAEALARALAAGVAPGQAAADLGVAPSTITRALQRGAVPGAAEHLLTIRRGYDGGQERQRDCRRLLQEARGRPTA